jgi:hypothetical protein
VFIFLRQEWLDKIKRVTGLDRAIGYTVLARGLQIIGSTGTVLLIVRFLSPVEQGYYYTLWSLVSLYVIFELGFSFVILQLAAHESAALVFLPDGTLKGDAKAHCRLASVLQKTVSWYLVAGGLMLGIMLPLGSVFFSKHRGAADQLLWQGPWACAVVATIAVFVLNPIFSFFEGCGQIVQVAWVRTQATCTICPQPSKNEKIGFSTNTAIVATTAHAHGPCHNNWSAAPLCLEKNTDPSGSIIPSMSPPATRYHETVFCKTEAKRQCALASPLRVPSGRNTSAADSCAASCRMTNEKPSSKIT